MNAPSLNAAGEPSGQDPQLTAITEHLTRQLLAQRHSDPACDLAIATDPAGAPVYMLHPSGSCPKLHKAAAQRLIAAGYSTRCSYIGGSTPLILATAA